jgi:hypothetical protein
MVCFDSSISALGKSLTVTKMEVVPPIPEGLGGIKLNSGEIPLERLIKKRKDKLCKNT